MPYKEFSVGDIILIPFPFSDLLSKKSRPAVILSLKTSFPDDIIIGAISSKKSEGDIVIENLGLEKGALPLTSFFKRGKIVTIDSSLIQKRIGKLNDELKNKILEETRDLF